MTYAAELFGPGSAGTAIEYPEYVANTIASGKYAGGGNPIVRLTGPAAGATLTNGVIQITFGFTEGAKIHGTVQASDFSNFGSQADMQPTIVDGGNDGDSSVTVQYGNGTDDLVEANVDAANPITFKVPRLKNLGSLVNASKVVRVYASIKIVSGTHAAAATPFPSGVQPSPTSPARAPALVMSYQAVTFGRYMSEVDGAMMSSPDNVGDNAVRIDIDDRTMLRANAPSGLYAHNTANPYRPNTFGVDGGHWAARMLDLELTVRSRVPAAAGCARDRQIMVSDGVAADLTTRTETGEIISVADRAGCTLGADILQWDGTKVDADVSGVLDVDVTGDRGLFNDADQVFVNYTPSDSGQWYSIASAKRSIDAGESLTVSDNMASFTVGGLSIDPGEVDEDDADGMLSRRIGVFYVPSGKSELAHGTMLKATAVVNYTPPTAADENAVNSSTELRIHGVDDELKAYAIPFMGNGKGDSGNVRIRCESGDRFSGGKECRAFLECWNDMGERDFGEVMPAIGANALTVLNSADVGEIAGMMTEMTRYSCRVLATGQPSVQQLTRDGSSGTLVNNTYVEDM